jgi:hypothetical protein
MALLTIEEVKTQLQITDTSKDDLIDFCLPIVEDDINTYCNTSYTDSWPIGMKAAGAQMVNYLMSIYESTGKQAETIGTYSYTNGPASNGYPDMIYAMLKKWRNISLKAGSVQTQWRDKRNLNLKTPSYNQEGFGVTE